MEVANDTGFALNLTGMKFENVDLYERKKYFSSECM
jgi:hypothetical protein